MCFTLGAEHCRLAGLVSVCVQTECYVLNFCSGDKKNLQDGEITLPDDVSGLVEPAMKE